MHIHILGICGTFMGSLALLAKALGHRVTGSDRNVYPPMSTQLSQAGIDLIEGFQPDQLDIKPDLIVVGNVISRGVPVMEAVLNRNLPYMSGPQWLKENVLQSKWVLAVSGTHGKTTTSSMLAWILEYAGMQPGFLIGGVPGNFKESARLGGSDFFVIEADEYDTAFFDKRSKFVHYSPRTLIVNNLEYDHADIFPDLASIQRQFHHLLRTVPGQGMVLYPKNESAITEVVAQGCWSESQTLAGGDWDCEPLTAESFNVFFAGKAVGKIVWKLTGQHSMSNAIAAIAAARHVGVDPQLACEALCKFAGVKRRMELLGAINGTRVYDDFAHHPTAIKTTLDGLREKVESEKVIAVVELRSNTMKQGIHKQELPGSVAAADYCFWYREDAMSQALPELSSARSEMCESVEEIVRRIVERCEGDTHVVIMSNGGFNGIHKKLLLALEENVDGASH